MLSVKVKKKVAHMPLFLKFVYYYSSMLNLTPMLLTGEGATGMSTGKTGETGKAISVFLFFPGVS